MIYPDMYIFYHTCFVCPFSWECHNPNWLTDFHGFSEGVGIPPDYIPLAGLSYNGGSPKSSILNHHRMSVVNRPGGIPSMETPGNSQLWGEHCWSHTVSPGWWTTTWQVLYPDASIQGMVFQKQRDYVPRLYLFRSQVPRSFWYKPVGMK